MKTYPPAPLVITAKQSGHVEILAVHGRYITLVVNTIELSGSGCCIYVTNALTHTCTHNPFDMWLM